MNTSKILDYNQATTQQTLFKKANVAALSGGVMSFYAAFKAIEKYGKENVSLYFNDTKWENHDLYRFLKDIEKYLGMEIIYDTDGRSPEQVFFENKFLGDNRIPLCSRILKAERLQKYYHDGDNLIFGIGIEEAHRARRIVAAYQKIYATTGKFCTLEFPIIENNASKQDIDSWFKTTGIELPLLYKLQFQHNNCNGGCIRQGKKQWKHLLLTLPEVYKEREDMEENFRAIFGDKTIMKDITLKEFRKGIEKDIDFDKSIYETDLFNGECIGICNLVA